MADGDVALSLEDPLLDDATPMDETDVQATSGRHAGSLETALRTQVEMHSVFVTCPLAGGIPSR